MARSKLRIVAPWLDRNAQDCSTSLGATCGLERRGALAVRQRAV